LAAAGGRVTGAARLLGVSRATLHRRLRSLAIRR
ncbi:MAG: helix-turn-helix domain-containing protein, partial [Ferrovibrionaceae bacterium]